jgi:hypothetical protein
MVYWAQTSGLPARSVVLISPKIDIYIPLSAIETGTWIQSRTGKFVEEEGL